MRKVAPSCSSVAQRRSAHRSPSGSVACCVFARFGSPSKHFPNAEKASEDRSGACKSRAEPGETLALVGAIGAGKSTIAKLLLRFYDSIEGKGTLGLRDLSLHPLRENVAVLLQETPDDPALGL